TLTRDHRPGRFRMLKQRQHSCIRACTALLATVSAAFVLPFLLAFAVAQDQPPAAAVLRGRVQDDTRVPLSGVRVRVAIPFSEMRFVNQADNQVVLLETVSDPNGNYRLEIAGIAKPTKVSVDALKPGYRRLSGTLMQGGDAPKPEVAAGLVADSNLT